MNSKYNRWQDEGSKGKREILVCFEGDIDKIEKAVKEKLGAKQRRQVQISDPRVQVIHPDPFLSAIDS